MRAKNANRVARMVHIVSRAASTAARRHVKPSSPPKESNLGRQIFVYNHLQTNQVVYSLTRSLKNNRALRQLPYNGKKTVPAALRKDLWAPLACINFTEVVEPSSDNPSSPSSSSSSSPPPPPALPLQQYGLKTFHKLREYRKLHETQWPASLARDPKTHRPLTRIARGRLLCDQKANTVADMAAALAAVTLRRSVAEVEAEADAKAEVEIEAQTQPQRPDDGQSEAPRDPRPRKVARRPLVRATVLWADLLDAEFAHSWPETVVHDRWVTTFNNRRAPVWRTEFREVKVEAEEGEEGKAGAEAEADADAAAAPEPVKNEAGKVVL